MKLTNQLIACRLLSWPVFVSAGLLCWWSTAPCQAAEGQRLRGHVPAAVAQVRALDRLPAEKVLRLAIGLPLRNEANLTALLQQLYDPASPNYRQWLTPEQFTERFGPTKADYQAVEAFAQRHGLTVAVRHPNRLVLDVEGAVPDIERAFQVTLKLYPHPTEGRTFYAPDSDPMLDLATPVSHIAGLDNYWLPHPNYRIKSAAKAANATPNSGSGTNGSYRGWDFRAAYVPGTLPTGSGQTVGLLQFEGYWPADITRYETEAGLPNVPVTVVPIDGGVAVPGPNNAEVCLDIEMAVSMAPGLSRIYVYEAPNPSPWVDLLSRMANDNLSQQLSCSWGGGGPDPTCEAVFRQMAAQGQSFFNASGDSDAFCGSILFPADSTNVTQVGGTALTTTGPAGAYVSETTWNRGGGIGSSGGVSPYYTIPDYQLGIAMTANQGSTTMRNIPDVALTAENVYVTYNNGSYGIVGGTSCAAPLWAGLAALINQQATANGRPTVGFVNPAIYAIGKGEGYLSAFHDITTGNNLNFCSTSKFYAVTGYDLCAGWGTPAGSALIDALAGPADALKITPASGFVAAGGPGGPFDVTTQTFWLTNAGTTTLNWSLSNTSLWLTVSPTGGSLAPGAAAIPVTFSLNTVASNAVPGTHSAVAWFTNLNSGIGQSRGFTLLVLGAPVISTQPANQRVAVGGTATFSVGVTGGPPLSLTWCRNGALIAGATQSSYTTNNVQLADNGSQFSCLVSNAYGTALSSNAVLTIRINPRVAIYAAEGLMSWDLDAKSNIVASGVYDAADVDVFDLETDPPPTLADLQQYGAILTWSDGYYLDSTAWGNLLADYVDSGGGVVVGAYAWTYGGVGIAGRVVSYLPMTQGAVAAAAAHLTLVTDQPSHALLQGVNTFDGATYSRRHTISTVSGAALVAHWSDGLPLIAAHIPSNGRIVGLNFRPISTAVNTYGYQAGTDGGRIMANALLWASSGPTTNAPPWIVQQPADQTVAVGGTATFSVAAAGTPPLSYFWKRNGACIAEATASTYTTNNAQLGDNGTQFSCLVSNAYGTALSAGATLTVRGTNSITRALVFFGADSGTSPFVPALTNLAISIFTVYYPSGYADFMSAVGRANPTNTLVVVDTPSFSSSVDFSNVVAFINVGGRAIMDFSYLEGWPGLAAAFQVATVGDFTSPLPVYDWGGSTLFSGLSSPLSFTDRWGDHGDRLQSLGSAMPFAGFVTSPTTNQAAIVLGNSGRTLVNGFLFDEITSFTDAVRLAQNEIQLVGGISRSGTPPAIVAQPQSVTTNVWATVTFSVAATGTPPLSYFWKRKGTFIAGATASSYTTNNVQLGDDGTLFSCLVSNAYGTTNSLAAILTVTNVASVDHYAWSAIASPQVAGTPFPATITALTAGGAVATNFNGSVNLSASGGGGTELLHADFESGLQGFTIDNTYGSGGGLWHLSTGRALNPGHSPSSSLYYGHFEGPLGGGNYDTGTNNGGVVVSAAIILPAGGGPITLSFNYLMNVEPDTNYDRAFAEISTNGGLSYLAVAVKGAFGGLTNLTYGLWVSNTVDLSTFAGSTVRLRFRFDTIDAVGNASEGWYLDDVIVRAGGGTPLVVTPAAAGPFVNGVWNGSVAVQLAASNVVLTASDGLHTGSSNPFQVVSNAVPVIAVTPASQDFGATPVGTYADRTFYVTNTGGGTLSGSAGVAPPFSIFCGGSYTLGSGQGQAVVVRYLPTAPGTNSASVAFLSSAGTAIRPVVGRAYIPTNALTFIAGNVSSAPGTQVVLPLLVAGFSNVSSFQFSFHWNTNVAAFVDVEALNLAGLALGNFGTTLTNQGTLTVSWDDPDGTSKSVTNGVALFAVRFQLKGAPGACSPVTIDGTPTAIEVYDGNLQPVSVTTVPGSVCASALANISGTVRYYGPPGTNATLPNVTMSVSGSASGSMLTTSNGTYNFLVPAIGTCCMSASKADDTPAANGVSTVDISLIRRHILSIAPLDSPYKLLAADVNGSASVTTLDITLIRRVILGITNSFPIGVWRFVPTNYVFADPLNPWSAPASCCYTNPADQYHQDWFGVKLGDVNYSWTRLASLRSLAAAAGVPPAVQLQASSHLVQPGQIVTASVSAKGLRQVTSAQFTLEWDPAVLSFTGTGTGALDGLGAASFGTGLAKSGKLTFSWDDPNACGAVLSDGEALFTLNLQVIGQPGTVSALSLSDAITPREIGVNCAPVTLAARDGLVSVVDPNRRRLLEPGCDRAGFHVSVATLKGNSYVLEYRESLESGQWTTLAVVPGDGTVKQLADPATNAPQRYYRVRIE